MKYIVIISRHNAIMISRISRKLRNWSRMCVCVHACVFRANGSLWKSETTILQMRRLRM